MSEPKPVRVLFKNEGDQGDDAIGPMRMQFEDDNPDTSQPYDPDRPKDSWVMRSEAQAVAAAAGVPFVER